MRTLSGIALGLALIGSIASAQTTVDRKLPLNADGSVRIHSMVGGVVIRGWNGDTLAVRGTVGRGSTFHMGGTRAGAKMFVESADERSPAPSALEIMVPARAKVWVKTATADVTISGVTGSLDVYVISGAIIVNGTPADLNAEAIDGDIAVIGRPGWVRAKSASGSITFRGSSQDAALSTVSGRLTIDGATASADIPWGRGSKFERARFETVSGDVRFLGDVERGADIRFDTHSGAVDVAVLRATSADFEASTISGTITNSITRRRPTPGRYGRGSELAMSAGDGGARISVRTFRGAITLRTRK